VAVVVAMAACKYGATQGAGKIGAGNFSSEFLEEAHAEGGMTFEGGVQGIHGQQKQCSFADCGEGIGMTAGG